MEEIQETFFKSHAKLYTMIMRNHAHRILVHVINLKENKKSRKCTAGFKNTNKAKVNF